MEPSKARSRSKQRRTYRLRKPEQSTQTISFQKPPSTKLDNSVQVWVVKEEPKEKMAHSDQLVNRSVQCIKPSLPGRLIILMLMLTTLCGIASYMTKGDIYQPTPPTPGQMKNLRDTFVEITWTIVKPFIPVFMKS